MRNTVSQDYNWLAMTFLHPIHDGNFYGLIANLLAANIRVNCVNLPGKGVLLVSWIGHNDASSARA